MNQAIRCGVALAAVGLSACTLSFAQSSGEAVANRSASTVGGNGLAKSGIGKLMKVKPITDADVGTMNEAEMIETGMKGSGKMEACKDSMSESQVKAAVDCFRGFLK